MLKRPLWLWSVRLFACAPPWSCLCPPGITSPEAITAAVRLLDAGLGSLLDGKGVSSLSQAKIGLAGFTTSSLLVLVEDCMAEFREWLKVSLGLDPALDPSCKLVVTVLVGCYEAAMGRFEKRVAADTVASSSRLPKNCPSNRASQVDS